jgi:hypothetical protein
MQTKPDAILFLDDHRGIYIPRDFAQSIKRDAIAYPPTFHHGDINADLDALLDPDGEQYWDTWSDICDNAIVTDDKGRTFSLYQDGALWLIPVGMEWSDEEQWFAWPDDTVHLLTTDGKTACNADSQSAGGADADINFVTCERCTAEHDRCTTEESEIAS